MKDDFPKQIPVFPLSGVIYFPKTNLPLNIFETRYLNLVNDCIKKDKLMGMVQSKKNGNEVYKIGCLGKISDFHRGEDNRVLINLTGVIRFEIKKEILNKKLYREFEVSYEKFNQDTKKDDRLVEKQEINLLFDKTKNLFKKRGLILNWKEFEKLDQVQQINTISMIAPISNEEKQKLLEAVSIGNKTKTLLEILEFYLYNNGSEKMTIQ
ncbi:MAG: ATP-dependent protease [Pelagibacterales bacterium MED-G40]|nr:MAG: ATP-dependent protease [Pelagibacterales bacterium MED-G40]|tara:strand:- start:1053 stop:1682 length:630 start_codon:yes stop_codon:yes gene_type:complete